MQKIYGKITIATFMQPVQCVLRCSAAKDNSITHTAVAPRNLDAATTMRFADTALENTIHLRTTAQEITAPKPDLNAQAEKKHDFARFSTRLLYNSKITSAKMQKNYGKITTATFMAPFQYHLRLHTGAFTKKSVYTQKLSHRKAFTIGDTFIHRNFYTEERLHTDAFTHKSFHTKKLLHTDAFTHRGAFTQKSV